MTAVREGTRSGEFDRLVRGSLVVDLEEASVDVESARLVVFACVRLRLVFVAVVTGALVRVRVVVVLALPVMFVRQVS